MAEHRCPKSRSNKINVTGVIQNAVKEDIKCIDELEHSIWDGAWAVHRLPVVET